jgi:hypothetical protein
VRFRLSACLADEETDRVRRTAIRLVDLFIATRLSIRSLCTGAGACFATGAVRTSTARSTWSGEGAYFGTGVVRTTTAWSRWRLSITNPQTADATANTSNMSPEDTASSTARSMSPMLPNSNSLVCCFTGFKFYVPSTKECIHDRIVAASAQGSGHTQ